MTYAKFRDEMVKRRAARYDPKTGKWEWEGPLKSPAASRTQELGVALSIRQGISDGLLNEPISHDPR